MRGGAMRTYAVKKAVCLYLSAAVILLGSIVLPPVAANAKLIEKPQQVQQINIKEMKQYKLCTNNIEAMSAKGVDNGMIAMGLIIAAILIGMAYAN
jgi:hypothetical protein